MKTCARCGAIISGSICHSCGLDNNAHVKQIAELQEKLDGRATLILKMQDELVELRQKIHKRNLQIADLKKTIKDLRSAVALGLRENQTAGDNR